MSKLSLIAAMALGGLVACSTLATAQDSTPTPDAKKVEKAASPSSSRWRE